MKLPVLLLVLLVVVQSVRAAPVELNEAGSEPSHSEEHSEDTAGANPDPTSDTPPNVDESETTGSDSTQSPDDTDSENHQNGAENKSKKHHHSDGHASEAEGSAQGSSDLDIAADKCKEAVDKCKNGGTCVNDYNKVDGYYCDCPPDFGGLDCADLQCRVSLPEKTSPVCMLRRQIGQSAKKQLIKLTTTLKEDMMSDESMPRVPMLLKKAAASFVQSASTDPFTIEWYMKMTDNADLNKDIESHFTLKDPRFHEHPNLVDFAIVYEAFYKHHKKYSAMSALKRVPAIEDNFYKDRCFADQRLAGANPFQIWRVNRDSRKAGVGWDKLYEKMLNKEFDWHKAFHKVMETEDNDALDKAIDGGTVFVTYYPELQNITVPKQLDDAKFNHSVIPLTAPLAFFVVKESEPGVRRLTPVAIQADADADAKVYTPEEGKGWFYAKAMVQRADFNVLHMVKKRLKTHLYLDAPCTLVEKYFSEYHPIHQMLRHHCRANLETNKLFELKLYGQKAPIYKALSIDMPSAVKMLNQEYSKMEFNDVDLVDELEKRGVDDEKQLPYYPYRDDGKKLYGRLKEFVRDYLRLYYRDDDDIKKDFELQEFANEMSANGTGDDGGLGQVKNFPAKIESVSVLSKLMTTFMWALSGQHAATTFPMLEYGGFVPNAPHRLFTDDSGEAKYSPSMFGNKGIALEIAELSSNVASIHLDSLFDYYTKMEDNQAKKMVHRFFENLGDLSKEILADNDQRVANGYLPYPYFMPAYVSNSAST